ncbi:methyl-accepting chemotaxis protein [Motilimonas cestriensis]|uniref:Methyl-accepting chemotaxis protein n=1 Tax=Motilimonas cestriensis TaxID=2742685 RepID=A0ABS8WBA7_9GAMM|nr:methyl-accepting chemotaxis protein [Motilimonas cestriensis]MCE2596304.1 methyl-accepting chemotaxis protein [Motilimonas cestriensis]
MTLKTKVWGMATLTLIALLGVMLMGLYTLRQASDTDNKSRIYQLLKSTYSTVNQIELYVASGKMSDEQGKELAAQILRENKYNDSEYVYVADENMNFVAAPHDPQLHGTSFHDFKDAQGASVGQILLDAVRSNPNGIVEYEWTSRNAEGEVADLLSVAQVSKRWKWAVGTGIRSTEVDERFWSSAQNQLILCLIIAAILGFIIITTIRKITTDLGGEPEDVLTLVRAVAAGDLSTKVKRDGEDFDESSIYGSVVTMQASLREIMNSVSAATAELRNEATSADNRSSQVDQVSDAQRSETDMVATSMTEMSSSARTVAESANNAAASTQEADAEGQRAQNIVLSSVSSIEGLASQIDEAAQVIGELGRDVDNIVSVLDVIRGIAEQTNLLALNAAIEAARAGEQGRGFAVVADEVRNLAKRTQDSTAEIQQMIERLQSGSQKAVSSMENSKTSSIDTVSGAQEAAQALQQIADSLGTITEMNHQIASAADEQTKVGDDISHRINSIADSSHQAAELARENRASTNVIMDLADNLEQQIRKFKVS